MKRYLVYQFNFHSMKAVKMLAHASGLQLSFAICAGDMSGLVGGKNMGNFHRPALSKPSVVKRGKVDHRYLNSKRQTGSVLECKRGVVRFGGGRSRGNVKSLKLDDDGEGGIDGNFGERSFDGKYCLTKQRVELIDRRHRENLRGVSRFKSHTTNFESKHDSHLGL